MTLKEESLQLLADTIAPQVFDELCIDGRYMDGIMNSMETAINEVIGRTSPELVGELGERIMAKIGVVSEPSAEIWRQRYETLYAHVKATYAESYVDGAEYGMNSYAGSVDIYGF